jgi:hypothetical protein
MIPSSDTMIGPGSLALCLGSEPGFSESTVWFGSTMEREENPEQQGPLRFDPENKWWKVHEATLRECAELARGRYLVGCPDLVENIDILASLRDMSRLFMDMIERPQWVSEKLWGPGKTAKVQCDAATMFSPEMFREFVVPQLRDQCAFLDYSMYHLDGNEQFRHLDALLEIEELDAIEWTPNTKLPLGGDPQWFDLYRRILDAGKSVQVYMVRAKEIVPVLDAIGSEGVYILGLFKDRAEVESVARQIEPYR